jgi:hypothetical protein
MFKILARRTTLFVLLSSGMLGLSPAHAQAPALQPVPGTTVSMVPPAGFVSAPDFSGFKEKDGMASIMVSELPPEAYPQLSAVFGDIETAKKMFAARGITVSAIKKVESASGPALLVMGTQTAGTVQLNKWIGLFKGQKTVLITFQGQDKSLTDEVAQKVVESTKLGDIPSLKDKVALLPFTFEAKAPFRAIDTVGGSGVVLMAGDKDVDPEGKQPLMVIAADVAGMADAGNLSKLSHAMLEQTPGLKDAAIDNDKSISFAGSDGVLLSGKAQDGHRFIQYVALGAQKRLVRLVAIMPAERVGEIQPAIEAIAQSITLKP